MENRKGVLTHFGGIIRIIILIISVAVITFFVVRFFRNRESTRTARESSQVAQTESKKNADNQKKTKEAKNGKSSTGNSGDITVPSGMAEGGDTDETSAIPAAGMGVNIIGYAVTASIFTYAGVFIKNKQRKTVSVAPVTSKAL